MGQTLKVAVIGDTASYARALKAAEHATEGFGSSIAKVAKVAAVAAGAAGIGAVFVTLKRGFSELGDSQKVMAQTNAVLKSTGGAANVSAKHVSALANSLSKLTGVDDENIQAGENWLLTFKNIRDEAGKGNDIFTQTTKVTLDLAAAQAASKGTAIDMASASTLMGKALNDPIKGTTALGKAGVTFTASQKQTIKALVESGNLLGAQKIILGEVKSQVEGSAKAYGTTLPGQISKLKNSFDDLAAGLVGHLVPSLTDGAKRLSGFFKAIGDADGAGAKLHVIAEGLKSFGTDVFNAIRAGLAAIDWGKVWDVIQINAAALIGKIDAALAGTRFASAWQTMKTIVSTAAKDIVRVGQVLVQFLQTDIGKATAIAAGGLLALNEGMRVAAAGMKIFAASAAAFGSGPTVAIFATAAAIAYLGLKLGILHNPFQAASGDAKALSAALESVQASAQRAGDAIERLKGSHLSMDEAQHRVTASLHDAQAAQATYNEFTAKGTQNTLAGKQAHDQAISSWDNHKRAVNDLTKATQDYDSAQQQTKASIAQAVPGLQVIQNKFNDMAHLSAPAATKAARALGVEMISAGQNAVIAGNKLQTVNPVSAAARRSFGTLQQAAGVLAIQLGKVPTNKQIVAKAKIEGGPKFISDLKTFAKGAQEAGVQVPAWITKAIGPTKAAATGVAEGAKAPIATLPPAGTAAGVGLTMGLTSSIIAGGAGAIAAAASIANAIKAILGPQFGSTPDVWAKEHVGSPLVLGIAQGIYATGPQAEKAAQQHKDRLKAIFEAKSILNSAAFAAAARELGAGGARALVAQLTGPGKTQLQQAIDGLRQAVADKKAAFISTFHDLADKAMAAFDARTDLWVNKFQKKLDAMQRQDQIASENQAVSDATTASTEAITNLGTTSAAATTAADDLTTALASGDEEAIKQATDAKATADTAVTASIKAVNDAGVAVTAAQRAQAEGILQRKADDAAKAHDAAAAKERRELQRDLNKTLADLLDQHKGMATYMHDSKVAAQDIAKALNAALNAMGIKTPKLDSGGYVARTGVAVVHKGETYSGVGNRLIGAGGGDVYVTVQGALLGSSVPEVAATIRRELIRTGSRNAGPLFGT